MFHALPWLIGKSALGPGTAFHVFHSIIKGFLWNLELRILGSSKRHDLQLRPTSINALLDGLDGVLRHAAGPDVGAVHAKPGDHLEDVENELALAEAELHGGEGAELAVVLNDASVGKLRAKRIRPHGRRRIGGRLRNA